MREDLLKKYINEKYPDDMRVNSISSISIKKVRHDLKNVDKESRYYAEAKSRGYVEAQMIAPIWEGWKRVKEGTRAPIHSDLVGTWELRAKRNGNRFSLDAYKEWVRHIRLEEIGIHG